MPTHLVNLDALLEREDFESNDQSIGGSSPVLFKAEELKDGRLFLKLLRKPHFQRETNNWSAERIKEFIKSFLDAEFIPSIIIWQSKATNKIFVIDGSHRVSSLIGWVNDDFGDGTLSRKAYNYEIPPAQKKFHKDTKALVETEIGSFSHLVDVARGEVAPKDEVMKRRASAIGTRLLTVQCVDGDDASVAESSFFKINCNAIPIDDTELDLLHARFKPNTLAARAFMRAGRGHKYWGKLPNAAQIEDLAKEVYGLVFGQILEIGSTSPDIPRAGQPYSNEAFKMTLDIVNTINGITPTMWQRPRNLKKPQQNQLPDDVDGTVTLRYLQTVKRVCQLSCDHECSGSFGLDHAVYCYGATGKFHSGALIASLLFASELDRTNKRHAFTRIRSKFEEFLVRHKRFINLLGHSKGSRTRSVESILGMYRMVMGALLEGVESDSDIVGILMAEPSLKALASQPTNDEDLKPRRKFSKTAREIAVVKETLRSRQSCPICGARVPPAGRSNDHIKRQEDGGLGTPENHQFTHPYCNTGYKEFEIAEERKQEEIETITI